MPIQTPTLQPMLDKLVKRTPLNSVEIDALLALPFRPVALGPVSYLVREGDRTDQCIVLLAGFASRSKLAGDGSKQILSVHMRGDIIDLQSCLLGNADHSLQALTPVDAAFIPHRALFDLAAAHPAVALALWRDTSLDGTISKEWTLNVGQRNARQRICHLLCELALRQQEAGLSEGPDYQWIMTQEQLGDCTGLTPIHVNRTIQRLRQDGLISSSRHTLTINDLPRLKAEGDFNSTYLHQVEMLAA